jgi:HEAT repeat protein
MSVFMLGVAGLMNDLSHILNPNPISGEKYRELEARYGRWALDTAIAVCPLDDVECIEREAKRLAEARFHRAYGR